MSREDINPMKMSVKSLTKTILQVGDMMARLQTRQRNQKAETMTEIKIRNIERYVRPKEYVQQTSTVCSTIYNRNFPEYSGTCGQPEIGGN